MRKIFSQRTLIPNDVNVDLVSTSIDSSASKQAAIPRGMDFLSSASKVNQVLSYDSVIGMSERKIGSIDDSMMVTGIKMSGFAKSQAQNPNVTASSGIGNREQTSGKVGKGVLTGKKKQKEDSNRAESCDAYGD